MTTWFITGAGRGLGKEFARAALTRGDQVVATVRAVSAVDDLVSEYGDQITPLILDVTDRTAVFDAVEAANATLGTIDVVVNNAGYGLFGAVEEISERQLRDQLEVNLFGVFHVTQAVLPVLRAQGSGHIIQISTIGGVAAFENLGGYHASKWALEGLTESLAQEVSPFGIKVTLIEPGPYGTDWSGTSSVHADPIDAYAPMREGISQRSAGFPADWNGDPSATGPAILKIVDADKPPLRAFFGVMPTVVAPQVYQSRLSTWAEWKDLAIEANG